MDHRRALDGWASWPFVLAAAVPAAAATRLGWIVLGGSVDAAFGSQDPPATGATLLGIRWSNLWLYPSVPLLLLTGLLPLLVLAAVVLAGRPLALVPPATARAAATLVAVATSALGVVGVAGFLAQLSGLLPVVTWSSPTGSRLDGFSPAAAAVLVTAVVGVAATCVLWPRAGAAPEDEEFPAAVVVELPEDAVGVPDRAPHDVARPVGLPEEPASHALPSVPVTDLDLYRRR